MIKVMIVDDEDMFRIGLRCCIDWNASGYEVVCEARDGQEALEQFERKRPDVVFTDIVMPKMDGIALTKEILDRDPGVKVIMLSCHSDFEYVKQALQLGAFDYLLKLSVKADEMEEYLSELSRKMCLQSSAVQNKQQQEETIRLSLIKEQFLQQALVGENVILENAFEQKSREFSISLSYNSLGVMLIRLQKRNSVIPIDSIPTDCLLLVREKVRSYFDAFELVSWKNTGFVVIHSRVAQGVIDNLFTALGDSVRDAFDYRLAGGISGPGHSFGTIATAFNEARTALWHSFYDPHQIVAYRDFASLSSEPFPLSLEKQRVLDNSLKGGDFPSLKLHFDEIVAHYRTCQCMPSMVRNTYRSICASCLGIMQTTHRKLTISADNIYLLIDQAISLEALNEAMLSVFHALCIEIASWEQPYRDEIKHVMRYIEQNHSKNVTLAEAASVANLSHKYFCNLFKQETGVNFKQYVAARKIELAKELLLQGMKVSSVAQRLGFGSSEYFSSYFRKYTGHPPSDYNRFSV